MRTIFVLMLVIIVLGCQDNQPVKESVAQTVKEQPEVDTLSVFTVALSKNLTNQTRGAHYLYFTWQKGTLDPTHVIVDVEGKDFVVYNRDKEVYRHTLTPLNEKIYLRGARMEFDPPSTYTLRVNAYLGDFGGVFDDNIK